MPNISKIEIQLNVNLQGTMCLLNMQIGLYLGTERRVQFHTIKLPF